MMHRSNELPKTYYAYLMRTLLGAVLYLSFYLVPAAGADAAESFQAYIGQLPPYNSMSKDGRINGIMVEILEIISKRAGTPITRDNMSFIPFARAVEEVKHTPGTVVFALARNAERESQYAWVGPAGRILSGLVAKKESHIRIGDETELGKYTIGTIRNSAPEARLREMLGAGAPGLVSIATNRQQLEMLANDRVDLVTQSNTGVPALLKELHRSPGNYEMVYVFSEVDLYFAFSPHTDPGFIERLNQELNKLGVKGPDGRNEHDGIVEKYMGDGGISVVARDRE